MTIQKLHFKIHPNILNLIRQAYWFEEGRQDWAMKCLHSLDGEGKMTLDMAFQLLNGDAHFITIDNGKTLTMIEKEDKEFKKEILKFKEFKKMQEKIETDVRETEEEKLELINRLSGLQQENNDIMEKIQKEANMKLAKQMFIQKMYAKTEDERVAANALMKDFRDKQYEFIFKGYHYRFFNSARNQSECPHCGERSKNIMWKDNEKGFIGYYDFGTGIMAKCFECPKCFQKFYFHTTFKDYKSDELK